MYKRWRVKVLTSIDRCHARFLTRKFLHTRPFSCVKKGAIFIHQCRNYRTQFSPTGIVITKKFNPDMTPFHSFEAAVCTSWGGGVLWEALFTETPRVALYHPGNTDYGHSLSLSASCAVSKVEPHQDKTIGKLPPPKRNFKKKKSKIHQQFVVLGFPRECVSRALHHDQQLLWFCITPGVVCSFSCRLLRFCPGQPRSRFDTRGACTGKVYRGRRGFSTKVALLSILPSSSGDGSHITKRLRTVIGDKIQNKLLQAWLNSLLAVWRSCSPLRQRPHLW